jgi:hypothetical protein
VASLMIDETSILRTRVDAVRAQIRAADRGLARILELEPHLQGRVSPRFAQALAGRSDRLAMVAESLSSSGTAKPADWQALADARTILDPIFSELHAFLQAAEARRAERDGGLLRLADALLDELGDADVFKARITVLADREYFGSLAEMIRIKFPDTTIWTLPVVAHEFAHFLVTSLRVDDRGAKDYPFERILDRAGNQAARRRLEELVADVCAAYLVGPAYAFTCVLLRWEPVERQPLSTHPVAEVRVDAVLRTLSAFSPVDAVSDPYRGPVEFIRSAWNAIPRPPADATDAAAPDRSLLEAAFEPLADLLRTWLPHVRYESFREAARLAPLLRADTDGVPDGAWSLADVLNAAWLARLQARADDGGATDARTVAAIESHAVALMNRRLADQAAGRAQPIVSGQRR